MENALQIFESEEFGKIRTLVIDGVIYFVGKDVATALGYENASKAIRDHVDAEDKKLVDLNRVPEQTPIADAVSGGWIKNEVICINESGLYSLIFSSKLPKAKEFKRWVTSKVLPQIRKYGYYVSPKVEKEIFVETPMNDFTPETALKALKDIVTGTQMLSQYLNMPKSWAILNTISVLEKAYGMEFDGFKKTMPELEKKKEKLLTPTQIGALTGKSAQYVNKRLCALGFQKKDFRGGYILTDKGREYGKLVPYEVNGHKYYQIKWDYCIRYVI